MGYFIIHLCISRSWECVCITLFYSLYPELSMEDYYISWSSCCMLRCLLVYQFNGLRSFLVKSLGFLLGCYHRNTPVLCMFVLHYGGCDALQ